MGYRYENLYIVHYGVPRRSGRYPWGSGDRPYQGDDDFKSKSLSTKIRLDDYRRGSEKEEPTWKNAGGDFDATSEKLYGDAVHFTEEFKAKPISDYQNIYNKTTGESKTTINIDDIESALKDSKIKLDNSGNSNTKDDTIKKAIKSNQNEKKLKNFTSGLSDTYKGFDSMVKEIEDYKKGKLSDNAKKKLDRKIRKMSDEQLSELARRMSLESSAIEQSNRRKRLTAKTGKSRTEHLRQLGLDGLNTTVGVINLISAIRSLSG